jgi:chemotaxis protein MotB
MALEEDPPAGLPEWLATFGDLMSLLLTFFILLVSMSEIKTEDDKFQALVEALQAKFGDAEFAAENLFPGFGRPGDTPNRNEGRRGKRAQSASPDDGGLDSAVRGDEELVRSLRQADAIVKGGAIPFTHGSAELTDEARQRLDQVLVEIRGKAQRIEVRGHTSRRPLPPDAPYRDAWDLAYARGRVVMEELVRRGIEPRRIRLGVAAQNDPAAEAADAELVERNNRVEVFLLDELSPGGAVSGSETEAPAPAAPPAFPVAPPAT